MQCARRSLQRVSKMLASAGQLHTAKACMGGECGKLGASRDIADTRMRRDMKQLNWGYGQNRGPSQWWIYYPQAAGKQQSPIDIRPHESILDERLADTTLQVRCETEECMRVRIMNTGQSWQVDLSDPRAFVEGGPAGSRRFLLEQFHMHWGAEDVRGSEHMLQGRHYAGELHFVYYNSAYSSFSEAASKPDGLLVTAVWLQLDSRPGSAGMPLLEALTGCIEHISHRGDSVEVPVPVNTLCLLPERMEDYWTYPGSFTNPPCWESVTWVVFRQPRPVTPAQLARCRELHCHSWGAPCHAFSDDARGRLNTCVRPPQPVGDRTVRASTEGLTRPIDPTTVG